MSFLQIIAMIPLICKTALELYRMIRDAKVLTPEAHEKAKAAMKDEQLKTILDELRKLNYEYEVTKQKTQTSVPVTPAL